MKKSLSSARLHVLAMGAMLCDHVGRAFFPSLRFFTCVGRIAFPLFAFLAVEGTFHTSDLRKYLKRLLVFALLSELPFRLFCSGGVWNLHRVNVLFTLMFGVAGICFGDIFRKQGKGMLFVLVLLCAVLAAEVMGTDYGGTGVAVMITFYLFRGSSPGERMALVLCQAALYFGLYPWELPVTVFGKTVFLPEQAFALLAFLPVFCYSGEKGCNAKGFRWLCYGFYPVHLLILSLGRICYG